MLNAHQVALLTKVVSHLLTLGDSASISLAQSLTALLTEQAEQREAMASAAKARARTGKVGAPRHAYTVELEPQWTQTVYGVKAVVELVNSTLASVGHRRRVTVASLGVSLSRAGQWYITLETTDGTMQLTVTKAKPAD